MQTNRIVLAAVPQTDFVISHIVLDRHSPINQHNSHIHRECEIYLNLSGDVTFEVENRIYPIARGSVIITRPMEYHHCVYHSDASHDHYWITFSAQREDASFRRFFDREPGKDNLIVLDEARLTECLAILEELLLPGRDPLACRIGFYRLIRLLDVGETADSAKNDGKIPPDVARALRYMEEHLTEDIEIGALASACCVSVNTLERHFRKTLGETPFATLRKKRLIASMQYLRGGNAVTEAAVKSGFSDYSNYIQFFRRQFGVTPLQYKKKYEQS